MTTTGTSGKVPVACDARRNNEEARGKKDAIATYSPPSIPIKQVRRKLFYSIGGHSCDEVSVDVIQLPLPEIDENQSRIVSS